MRTAERNFYHEQLELNNQDLRKSWKIIKVIIGKNNNPSNGPIEFEVNGCISSNSSIITNAFNKYFIEVGPKLASNIKSNINPTSYVSGITSSIYIPDITEIEIRNVVNTLKNSSPGWDEIQPKMFKSFIDLYINPLMTLINMSFKQGVFPAELKIAKVIPIYKTGNKKDISNYRPISVLSFFSKIFEKIMYNYLIGFITKHDILYKFRFGFRKQYSTNHAIISLVEKINDALAVPWKSCHRSIPRP